jgi:hypothetical protein
MDEKYRLIFSGELLDGQHRAVVKRRLTELLKLKDGQIEKLFSGQTVILKRGVNRETAARYQALFRKAGGQLRVKSESPAEGAAVPNAPAAEAAPSPSAAPAESAENAKKAAGKAAADIEAPDFQVQTTWFPPPAEPRAEIDAPDYSVAAVGSDLADRAEAPVAKVAEVDFGLAEVGADLLTDRKEAPVLELGPLNFEVAEVGADIGTPRAADGAVAPDVSHIALADS